MGSLLLPALSDNPAFGYQYVDQVLFIGTSTTRVSGSKKIPEAGAGTQGTHLAPTAPSPSPSRSVGQGTCLGKE